MSVCHFIICPCGKPAMDAPATEAITTQLKARSLKRGQLPEHRCQTLRHQSVHMFRIYFSHQCGVRILHVSHALVIFVSAPQNTILQNYFSSKAAFVLLHATGSTCFGLMFYLKNNYVGCDRHALEIDFSKYSRH